MDAETTQVLDQLLNLVSKMQGRLEAQSVMLDTLTAHLMDLEPTRFHGLAARLDERLGYTSDTMPEPMREAFLQQIGSYKILLP